MEQYIGLDVSLKESHICVVEETGAILARGREATHPELLAKAMEALAPSLRLAVLETGGQSSWLQGALLALEGRGARQAQPPQEPQAREDKPPRMSSCAHRQLKPNPGNTNPGLIRAVSSLTWAKCSQAREERE